MLLMIIRGALVVLIWFVVFISECGGMFLDLKILIESLCAGQRNICQQGSVES
jgi:hypothetical protein